MTIIVLRALAEASVRASVVALLVALLLAALRVRAGAVRHAAWTAVVAAMLAMPLLPSLVPAITIITIRSPPSAIRDPQSTIGRWLTRVDANRAEQARPLRSLTRAERAGSRPSLPTAGGRVLVSTDQAPAAGLHEALERTSPAPTPSAPTSTNGSIASRAALLDAIPSAILTVYLLGVAALLARAGLGWRAARQLKRRARAIADREIASHARTPIAIRESADVITPMTLGILTPTILLPLTWRGWPDATCRAVLAHEQAHVERRDTLVALVAQINRAIFWFHPLAWWLTRTLASEAEHACDTAALRAAGEPQRYAALLIELARAVHDGGGRLTPTAIGLGGRGLLDRRIDRVLHGVPRDPSAATRIAVAVSAVLAIGLVAACRLDTGAGRFPSNPTVEQRDRNLRRVLRALDDKEYFDFRNIDWDDVPKQIASLEARVAEYPDDLEATKQLLLGYWVRPSVERRRPLILRLIERHPDAELAGAVEARLFPRDLDPPFEGDPVGYQRAKTLWLAHVDRLDASVAILGNASYFFETADRPLAEQLLLRARAQDPRGPWTARLGRFYARVLTGARGPAAGAGRQTRWLRTLATADRHSPDAIAIRKKLGESTDDELLAAAGWFLARGPRWNELPFDADRWAEACLKRALQLNPQAVLAHTELLALAARDEWNRGEALWNPPPADRYRAVSALPDAERFVRLPRLARDAYVSLGDLSRWRDPNLRDRVALAEQQARDCAKDTLSLASKFRDHPQYGTAIYTANITLGALALRAGDRAAAVRFLMKASDAPVSEELAYGNDVISGLRWNLAKDLYDRGERDAVIVFLRRMAETSIAHRADLREAAAAISRGDTPKL
jgi:beta-lactamase regulating signal transducer with metallopeptidase domain